MAKDSGLTVVIGSIRICALLIGGQIFRHDKKVASKVK